MSAQAANQSVRPVNDSLVCPLRSKGLCPWAGAFDNCQPAEGGASETQKAGSARLVINVQIPDKSVGHKPVASQRKIAGIAGQQNLLRPGSLITKKSCSL
jgi:hypothetical protein